MLVQLQYCPFKRVLFCNCFFNLAEHFFLKLYFCKSFLQVQCYDKKFNVAFISHYDSRKKITVLVINRKIAHSYPSHSSYPLKLDFDLLGPSRPSISYVHGCDMQRAPAFYFKAGETSRPRNTNEPFLEHGGTCLPRVYCKLRTASSCRDWIFRLYIFY